MPEVKTSAGDPLPPHCRPIEVHVAELKQLFNAIDPSPFRERDLDPNAEEFIVEWGRELGRDAPLALVVHLDRPAGLPEEPAILRDAVREFFAVRAETTRRRTSTRWRYFSCSSTTCSDKARSCSSRSIFCRRSSTRRLMPLVMRT